MRLDVLTRKRKTTLDFVKLIASYFVVFIHIPFYGNIGNVINAIRRFAAPSFSVS